MEITILSGKGGTGKTTVAAGLGEIFKDSIKVDCDVDAANLYLYYKGEILNKEKFYSGKIANINLDKCHRCNKCVLNCHFEAIKDYKIDDLKCEGCGVCKLVCPFDAIELKDNNIADIIELKLDNGFLVMADMKIGSDGSGKLILELREKAKKYNGTIIVDGSPGIGCPVISSITGTDLVIIVTEPTMSGLGDLERILKLVTGFNLKKYVCINKYDINLAITEKIKEFCNKNNIEIIGQIPFDSTVVKSVNNLKPIVLYEDSLAGKEIKEIANRIKKINEEEVYESSNSSR